MPICIVLAAKIIRSLFEPVAANGKATGRRLSKAACRRRQGPIVHSSFLPQQEGKRNVEVLDGAGHLNQPESLVQEADMP